MIEVGFTGTSKGMTPEQQSTFKRLIKEENPKRFHHGDCIGADFQAHKITHEALRRCTLVVHPPENHKNRAWAGQGGGPTERHECCTCSRVELLPEKSYLKRNQDIVNQSGMLIATPFSYEETLRSGTWSTVRYAHKQGKRVLVIFPDGDVEEYADMEEIDD